MKSQPEILGTVLNPTGCYNTKYTLPCYLSDNRKILNAETTGPTSFKFSDWGPIFYV